MKKLSLLFIMFFLAFNTKAQQPIDVIDGIDAGPNRLHVYNDYMYFSTDDYIYRFQLSNTNPVLEELYYNSGADFASILIYNNDLYICSFLDGLILKMDISSNSPSVTTLISGLEGPNGMAIKDNYLYFSESNADKISKINLANTNPIPEVVLNTGLNFPSSMVFNGNDLYVSEIWGDKVSKIDITTLNKIDIASFDGPIGLRIVNQSIYAAIYLENRIVKFDTSSNNPTIEDIITNIYQPSDIAIVGEDMYIAHSEDGIISKIENVVLKINENENENLDIMPNPATEYIHISTAKTMDNAPYSIIDLEGKVVLSGKLNADKIINIKNIRAGIYILLLDNKLSNKIIKK